ncbi:nucleotidyltransferase family protein [Aurantiacibacter spongiae]|uniref:MobA-like NTP transferase domain-containing protein n=1 Tax=Aurantiacibacter spongiae TaxID=2488860 RepID=A0A3N5CVB3_9SPHN|nr:NTP transferase domain-containing protein [Aurantiacibacter spongiae]RPF72286.1 hypothetical protein EG799_12115 [Aurantiacibacter spongiae]
MPEADRPPLVAVLAAGRGARFGGGKLDAECAGCPVGAWVLRAVREAGLAPGILIVPPAMPRFARRAEGWRIVVNPAPENGLGGSLAIAAREALAEGRDLLILLADMPLIDSGHIARLARSRGTVATCHGERPGVPARFALGALPGLATLRSDLGAAPLLAAMDGLHILQAPAGTLLDVDRPSDLEEAARRLA